MTTWLLRRAPDWLLGLLIRCYGVQEDWYRAALFRLVNERRRRDVYDADAGTLLRRGR